MRSLLMFGNPWCLFSLLLLIALLLIAAALQSRTRSRRPTEHSASISAQRREEAYTAVAPLEALAVLHERLADILRHLPADSSDRQWLAAYVHDLRSVSDDVFWSVQHTDEPRRTALLNRLGKEVERLDQVINTRLSTTIGETTDRDALRAQLDQLRHSVGKTDFDARN